MRKTRLLILGLLAVLVISGTIVWRASQLAAQQASRPDALVRENPAAKTEPATQLPPEARHILTGVRSFTGRVVQVGGRYLFHDALLGAFYDLDPQSAGHELEGMTVRLNGALDPSGKTIHLEPSPHR